jgi:hypothetical protein
VPFRGLHESGTVPDDGRFEARVEAGGGAVSGLSPRGAPFVEIGGALGGSGWGGGVTFRYVPPSEAITDGDQGLRVRAVGGRAAAYHAPLSFVRVSVGLSAYQLEARGLGIRYPTTDQVWLFAPEAEAAARTQLGASWALALALNGRLGINTPRFEVQPETEVFRVPRVGGGAVLRIEWNPR